MRLPPKAVQARVVSHRGRPMQQRTRGCVDGQLGQFVDAVEVVADHGRDVPSAVAVQFDYGDGGGLAPVV